MTDGIVLSDGIMIERTLKRIAHEMLEKNGGTENLVLVGIRTRGVPMANRIANNIEAIEGIRPPIGMLDITLYRDDRAKVSDAPTVKESVIPCDIRDKNVVLIDDVLFTGRTARAAIEALLHFGRPRTVQLAVLIDRGHRELPIRADYVGKNVPTSLHESVAVRFDETDGENCVRLLKGSL